MTGMDLAELKDSVEEYVEAYTTGQEDKASKLVDYIVEAAVSLWHDWRILNEQLEKHEERERFDEHPQAYDLYDLSMIAEKRRRENDR